MNSFKKSILSVMVVLLLFFAVFTLTGCANKAEDDPEMLAKKVDAEIDFLDSHIITLTNAIGQIMLSNYKVVTEEVEQSENGNSGEENNSSNKQTSQSSSKDESEQANTNGQSKNDKEKNKISRMAETSLLTPRDDSQIDWNNIQSEIEILYSSWPVSQIDLQKLNVPGELLLKFNSQLDLVAKAVKEKNKTTCVLEASNLYNLLPQYTANYSSDSFNINLYFTKANILSSYALVENQNWDEAKNSLLKAEQSFVNILNDTNLSDGKQADVSQGYVLLKELLRSTDLKDTEVFLVKYKNTIEQMNWLL